MKDNQNLNVTLRDEEKRYFPCPVCGELKELCISSKGKPYLTCNDCGVQLFIRGKEGIKKISKQFLDYSNDRNFKAKISRPELLQRLTKNTYRN